MRHYPTNSPQAAARILALALLADGAIDSSELASLSRAGTLPRLGLDIDEFEAVIHALCEDLLVYSHRVDSGLVEIGEEALLALLHEIRNPLLQKRLLRAVIDIVHADGALARGETLLISCAAECWGINVSEMFPSTARPLICSLAPPPGILRHARHSGEGGMH